MTKKYKHLTGFILLCWVFFSLPGLTLSSFASLLGPKVAYCHLPLPCCQSSSSNTLALSARWPSFSHARTHTIWQTKGAFGAFISFSLMAFSRLAYTWALIYQIVQQNPFMCVFLCIYSLRDFNLSCSLEGVYPFSEGGSSTDIMARYWRQTQSRIRV